MFDYLIGKVSYKNNSYLILESNFKGYKIYLSDLNSFEENTNIRIYISAKIYQNNKNNLVFEYYGFKSVKEKIFFENLLNINGVGPKTALGIMKHDLTILKELIVNEDIDSLSVLEGLNNKIALAIITALSYKLKNEKKYELSNNNVSNTNSSNPENEYNAVSDLISALKALGYKKNVIEKAVSELMPTIVNTKENEISELISEAIKVILNENPASKTTNP